MSICTDDMVIDRPAIGHSMPYLVVVI